MAINRSLETTWTLKVFSYKIEQFSPHCWAAQDTKIVWLWVPTALSSLREIMWIWHVRRTKAFLIGLWGETQANCRGLSVEMGGESYMVISVASVLWCLTILEFTGVSPVMVPSVTWLISQSLVKPAQVCCIRATCWCSVRTSSPLFLWCLYIDREPQELTWTEDDDDANKEHHLWISPTTQELVHKQRKRTDVCLSWACEHTNAQSQSTHPHKWWRLSCPTYTDIHRSGITSWVKVKVKWITLITASSWHLLVWGLHQGVHEQLVFKLMWGKNGQV